MRLGIGFMKINDIVRVRYIGEDDPLMMLHGKEYDARVLKLGWFGVVDETHEEYAYPPELFELLTPDKDDVHEEK